MQVQTQYFQLVANVTTGSVQSELDTARSNLQAQVNQYLSTFAPHLVLDVTAKELEFPAGNAQYILLTAEVTYRTP